MNRQVERMVRSLDVRAAHAHARASTGQPFVAARSEINGAASRAASAFSSRKQRGLRLANALLSIADEDSRNVEVFEAGRTAADGGDRRRG
jgi:hypothetical protein